MKQPKSWHADCCSHYLEVADAEDRSRSYILDRIIEVGLTALVVGAGMSKNSASLIQLMIVTGAISMKTSIKSSGHLALAILCLLSGCATSDTTYTPE
jgi:hypothetical protein